MNNRKYGLSGFWILTGDAFVRVVTIRLDSKTSLIFGSYKTDGLFTAISAYPPASQATFPPCLTSLYYIDEGYSITLTDAPNDFGGKLCRNCALTTPELPKNVISRTSYVGRVS